MSAHSESAAANLGTTVSDAGEFGMVGALLNRIKHFGRSFSAAVAVSHEANRYQAMTEQDLAAIGMTREDVNTRLREMMCN